MNQFWATETAIAGCRGRAGRLLRPVLLAALLVAITAGSGLADQRVKFYSDGVPDHLWPDLRRHIVAEKYAMNEYLEGIRNYRGMGSATLDDAWKRLRTIGLLVAEVDLNRDGVNELVVELSDAAFGFCGSGGCAIELLEKRGGEWKKFGFFYDRGFKKYIDRFFVSDKSSHGRRSLYNPFYSAEWTGTSYVHNPTNQCTSCEPPWLPK